MNATHLLLKVIGFVHKKKRRPQKQACRERIVFVLALWPGHIKMPAHSAILRSDCGLDLE